MGQEKIKGYFKSKTGYLIICVWSSIALKEYYKMKLILCDLRGFPIESRARWYKITRETFKSWYRLNPWG